MLNSLQYIIDNRTYSRRLGTAYQLISYEKGVKAGDIRSIEGQLFYAYKIVPDKKFAPPIVCWCMCNLPSVQEKADANINKFFDSLHAQIPYCIA